MRHPEVIIIYTPDDGQAHMIGAHHKGDKWTYSKPSILPIDLLDEFLHELESLMGMKVLNVQREAARKQPGMEKATPIVVVRDGVKWLDAVDAMTNLHTAILNSKD